MAVSEIESTLYNISMGSGSFSDDISFVEDQLEQGLDFSTEEGQEKAKQLVDFMKKTLKNQQSVIGQFTKDIKIQQQLRGDAEERVLSFNKQLEETCAVTQHFMRALLETVKVSDLFGQQSLLDPQYIEQFQTIETHLTELELMKKTEILEYSQAVSSKTCSLHDECRELDLF